jgi:predicted metal-dependent peptidase
MKEASFNLNTHMARLLMDEPFFAVLSRQIEKRRTEAIPTAGVCVNPDTAQFELLYNPTFFEGLTDSEKKDVLLHEFYHCVFEHVTGRMPEGKMSKLWNFATDLAINSHLSNLPEGCLMPGVGMFEDLPPGKSAEWYYNKLKSKQPEDDEGEEKGKGKGKGEPGDGEGKGEPGQGEGHFDSHEGWEQVDEQTKAMARERIKDSIKKAAEECAKSRSWGSVSGDLRKDILDRLTAKVDWKKVLRYFVKTSQKANKASTMKRINRRYPYVHPGRKTSRTAKIAVSIDQSGSVSDGMLAAFFSELNKLAEIAEFTVVPFDDKVFEEKVYVWKKNENRKRERVLCGGTDFDAPTEYVNGKQFDGHIVLTDMYAPKPKASKCQRMWMTTADCARHPYFQTSERVIAINEQ